MTEPCKQLLERIEAYRNGCAETDIEIYPEEPMERHTTMRVGGPADLYLIPDSREALLRLCRWIRETGVHACFLGNGSNVLFADEGYAGAVISMSRLKSVRVEENCIRAEAGASVTAVCKAAREAAQEGMEFAYGIPGSIGGAVLMNAGAYGGEIAGVLSESTYLDTTDFSVHTISLADHAYGYRDSVYKKHPYVILEAVFSLCPGKKEEIAARMDDYMQRRVTKQPLEYPSAGSVFKRYPGRYTGQMIEEAGLKGFAIGGAQVSEKHAGFIINTGGATCRDVLQLIEHIRTVIFEKYGCALECEVITVQ